MSIFWLGGPKRIVTPDELKKEMFEDRFFKPGIIHGGEDYLIRVYINDATSENEPDEFVVDYLTKDLITKAHTADPMHTEFFEEIINTEAENFGCYNDGTGDFAALVEEWPKAVPMTNDELVSWAVGELQLPVKREDLPELLGQIIDTFEDFLEEKGIDIPNDEKDENPDGAAIIYGTDYGLLQSQLEELLVGWGIVPGEVR